MRRSITLLSASFLLICAHEASAQRLANPLYEPPTPAETIEEEQARQRAWEAVEPGLHGALGSIDVRYPRDFVPDVGESKLYSGTAWRGERLNAQFMLWSAQPVQQLRLSMTELVNDDGVSLGADAARAAFVRYVLADDVLMPDVLDTATRLDLPERTARPIWVRIDVPPDAAAGGYSGQLHAHAAGGASLTFDITVEVLPLTLPSPRDWSFHLDLWQNPYAVARYHRVDLWSDEHFALMEPHLRMLASAGQKCLTTTILHRPWGTQTFDPYDSMVRWIRRPDGSWDFDYSVFDRYVAFGATCGLDRAINCYSMVPWTNSIRYLDEASGEYIDVAVQAGDEKFIELWTVFLTDFASHLRQRGWLNRTAIAMDERPLEMMRPTIELVRKVAPELQIALAGSNEPKLKDDIDDWCVYITPPLATDIADERTARDKPTTFYVCCVPPRPNTFTFSPPAESAWLGLYAAARGYTGFLRWAYDSWTEDPLWDTKHVTWAAGDCFLVYPNARSSIRFERLREGIQDFEKIRILRQLAGDAISSEMKALDAALAEFSYQAACEAPAERFVHRAKAALEAASRAAAETR